MASFIEIKKLIYKLCIVDGQIDIDDDISMSINGKNIVLKNDALQELHNKFGTITNEKLELFDNKHRECILEVLYPLPLRTPHIDQIKDSDNDIIYSVGSPSPEFTVLFLDQLADYIRLNCNGNEEVIQTINIRYRRNSVQVTRYTGTADEPLELLTYLLHFSTIKVCTEQESGLDRLRQLATSLEFLIMYKKSISICEISSIESLVDRNRSLDSINIRAEITDPPRRIYNSSVISYYTMALESYDPFTVYISYYHIIEHYYDAVFRKNLINSIREVTTHPDFSYKDDNSIYSLALYVKKHMKMDEETGKGNELESLKYVLKEYVIIDQLVNSINLQDRNAASYYQNSIVPFTSSEKTKIQWANTESVYTNLANRIYETRNSLVHSKSEKMDKQYKPYKDKQDLIKELPLIRAVAEQVIINSGTDIQ